MLLLPYTVPLALTVHRDLLWAIPLAIAVCGIVWWIRHRIPANAGALDNLRRVCQAAARCKDAAAGVATGNHALANDLRLQSSSLTRSAEELAEVAAHSILSADAADEAARLAELIRKATGRLDTDVDVLLAGLARSRVNLAASAEALQAVHEIAVEANLLALSVAVHAARGGAGGERLAGAADGLRTLAVRGSESVRAAAARVKQCMEQSRISEQAVAALRIPLSEADAAGTRAVRLMYELSAAEREQSAALGQLQQVFGKTTEGLNDLVVTAGANATAVTAVSTHAGQIANAVGKLAEALDARTLCLPGAPSIGSALTLPAGSR